MYLASSWRSHWKVDNSRRGCGCGPLQQVWCSNKIRTLERKKIIKQERGGDEEIKKSSSSALLSTDRLDPMFPKRGRRAREFKTDNRSSQTREREVVKSYFLSSFLVSVDDAKQRETMRCNEAKWGMGATRQRLVARSSELNDLSRWKRAPELKRLEQCQN